MFGKQTVKTASPLKMSQFEPMIDVDQLAAQTGMSKPFIMKARYHYNLPHYKLGGTLRFRLSEVAEWVKQRKASTATA